MEVTQDVYQNGTRGEADGRGDAPETKKLKVDEAQGASHFQPGDRYTQCFLLHTSKHKVAKNVWTNPPSPLLELWPIWMPVAKEFPPARTLAHLDASGKGGRSNVCSVLESV